jgi:hypothetical protein
MISVVIVCGAVVGLWTRHGVVVTEIVRASEAPAKRQRLALDADDNAQKIDRSLSAVSLREYPVQKRSRAAAARAAASASKADREVVTLFLMTGSNATESGGTEHYVICKLSVRLTLRGKYVKLAPSEKTIAAELVDAFRSAGHSLNAAIEQVKTKLTLFRTLCVASYKRFQRQCNEPKLTSAPTQPSRKRGRPCIVTKEHRKCIKDMVSVHNFCALPLERSSGRGPKVQDHRCRNSMLFE